MPESESRVFTVPFFVMCGFSFTAFFSTFMLLPTAPFHILDLGGSKVAAGLFLGFLTYSSALSAPITGALADRLGKRRVLIACGLLLAGLSTMYALSTNYWLPLALVLLHGILWSALLSASAAYMTDLLPEKRRAEGISYWGIAGTLAIATAPPIGFWLYQWGWSTVCGAVALSNLAMVAVAWRLDEAKAVAGTGGERFLSRNLLEWRVLATSPTLFLCSFGYGGITSFVALYAEANQVTPRGIYFTTFAVVMIVSRPTIGRLADRVGYRKVFLPCLGLVVLAMLLLSLGGTLPWLLASAVIFGVSFGSVFPIFMAIVMKRVAPTRRGAAFGGILAAFDTGIGTGSIAMGWMLDRIGFGGAFGVATALACLSVPYFLFADRRFLGDDDTATAGRANAA